MNGDGARAGFKQVIAERKQADLGATGLGRLVISDADRDLGADRGRRGLAVRLQARGRDLDLTGATVTPSGPPAAYAVDLGAVNPVAGDTITVSLHAARRLEREHHAHRHHLDHAGQPNQFTIGATSDVTARQPAGRAHGGGRQARRYLAHGGVGAWRPPDDFFNIDAANPPQRVAGPPFDTATAFVAGTAANTVTWYTGETGSRSRARHRHRARSTHRSRCPTALRANEQGIRWVVQNVAALAAMTFSPSDPNAAARSAALNQRVGNGARRAVRHPEDRGHRRPSLPARRPRLSAAGDRHQQTKSTLADMLEQIEGVSTEEVAAQILALQTRLQASLQTTALLYQTSLVNYI